MALRPADILAMRSGGGDVLAFKASVDELSRLSAGRAEDESLLQQIEEKLAEMDPSIVSRLLMECKFRDEWREQRCQTALRALPSDGSMPNASASEP